SCHTRRPSPQARTHNRSAERVRAGTRAGTDRGRRPLPDQKARRNLDLATTLELADAAPSSEPPGLEPPGLRCLAVSGEALGLATALEALHVDDLAVAKRHNLVPLVPACFILPARRADDDVLAHLHELGLDHDPSASAFFHLELQDLT